MRGAGRGQLLPPFQLRIGGQAAVERWIRHRRNARFLQHPQAVQLAGRLDDPGQHQLGEHLVATGGVLEPQHPVAVSESAQQVAHPRRGDRQRATRCRLAQAQVEFALASGQALPRRGLQHLHPGRP